MAEVDPLTLLAKEHEEERAVKSAEDAVSDAHREILQNEINFKNVGAESAPVVAHPAKAKKKATVVKTAPAVRVIIKEQKQSKKNLGSPRNPERIPLERTESQQLDFPFEDEWRDRGRFPGENKMLECPFLYVSPDQRIKSEGILTITNYQMYFEPFDLRSIPGGANHLTIPVANLGKIQTKKSTRGDDMQVSLNITTRDFRSLKFLYSTNKKILSENERHDLRKSRANAANCGVSRPD